MQSDVLHKTKFAIAEPFVTRWQRRAPHGRQNEPVFKSAVSGQGNLCLCGGRERELI